MMKHFSFGALVVFLITGALAAPLPVEGGIEPIIEGRGGPGSSSWPPSWMKSSEDKPILLARGGGRSVTESTLSGRGGPGSSSWPPSWMKSTEDKPTLLTRGGPGSSSWPPSWMKSSTKSSKSAAEGRGGPGSSS
ncbi:MAG: hypothetical protein NXY57DRAFT_389795 [Lentinula lateritia]|uniref:Secreted protein n=1 Tax=Lentinula lateritia TaxID=40482 RepID=A0ABQ8UW45_9AGAR|nr:MAG: hypothetical protein NXY57DRAFT_389795 [Lentinula lateritia]KAJ4463563.1 hypothetical protein C8R41DRAFT_145016 [Lentinula lateritia]